MNCAVHSGTPAVAYCRTCGKALCEECKRDVMGAIYCEPCIAVRLQGATAAVPPPPAHTPVIVASAPSPGVAMLLGFIPGVGAMYNGQFMKGFLHVLIFVMLIMGASYHWSIDWVFGVMIGFFVIYMAFDAYKTAEAKRLNLPLPDPLGLDRLFGLQEGQHASAPVATPAASASVPGMATLTESAPTPTQAHVPTGAVVLIILGVVFLLGNLTELNLHRFWPLILVAVGLWLAYKRMAPGTREAR